MKNKKLCDDCNKEPAEYHVKDTLTGEIKDICAYCENPNYVIEIIEQISTENKEEDPTIKDIPPSILEKKEIMGRLHIVKKTKKPSQCRECKKDIPIGSSCYNQSLHVAGSSFGIQGKVCLECGELIKKLGIEVV